MGFPEIMRTWSNINCALASTNTYLEQRMNGVSRPNAGLNLIGNLFNGVTRNEIAYEMQNYGDPRGNLINGLVGYGNPVSNTVGTLSLMSACTPWMYFNTYSYFTLPPMNCGGFYANMGMGFAPLPPMGGPHGCCHGYWC